MKKTLLLATAFLIVATLSVGFSSADSNDAAGSGQVCAEGSQPCCRQKSQCSDKPAEQGKQPSCCLQSNEDTNTVAKDEASTVAGDDDKAKTGHGPGHGMGRGPGHGMGRGPAMMGRDANAMEGMREDMSTLHAMFGDRDKIRRKVTNLPNGAEAITESDDEEIAALLREHVPAMEDRVVSNAPLPPMTFHPIFVELIKHADKYTLTYEDTAKGIKVKYASDDPQVVMLVQEHAKLVSRFIKNGMEEIHKPYTLPKLSSETAK